MTEDYVAQAFKDGEASLRSQTEAVCAQNGITDPAAATDMRACMVQGNANNFQELKASLCADTLALVRSTGASLLDAQREVLGNAGLDAETRLQCASPADDFQHGITQSNAPAPSIGGPAY